MAEERPPFTEPLRAPLHPLAALLDPLQADAAERRAAIEAGRQLGPVTGLPALDAILSGRLEVGLHVIMGSAGGGKTALALQIACNCGVPALFVSAEISPVEIMRRLIASRTSTYLGKLKNGSMSGAAVRSLAEKSIQGLGMLGLMDATRHPAPTEHLAESLLSVRNAPGVEHAKGPGALVVVDSLQSWGGRSLTGHNSEYDRLGAAFEELEALAHGAGVPIVIISEQTKDAMKDEGGGGLNSGAGHRRISYAPESVFIITRDKNAKEAADGSIPVLLKVEKNRHGKTGSVPLTWNGGFQRYEARA